MAPATAIQGSANRIVRAVAKKLFYQKLDHDLTPMQLKKGDLLTGTIERYRLIEEIDSAGENALWRVIGEKSKRSAIAKVPPIDNEAGTKLFYHEIRALAMIDNPHVVSLYDFGNTIQCAPFYVMEDINGHTLRTEMLSVRRGGGKGFGSILTKRIGIQICEAVIAAHTEGIIHGDLKPHNIFLVVQNGDPDFVKLIDFGMALYVTRALNDIDETIVAGSMPYIPPEQWGRASPHPRRDVFAIGVILYELICNEMPGHAYNLMHNMKPLYPSEVAPEIPISRSLERVVIRAIEYDPDKRYQTVKELKNALERCTPQIKE